MKKRLGKILLRCLLALLVMGAAAASILWLFDRRARSSVGETRRALRAQGFKTDLADFNFSTSAEMRARESALTASFFPRRSLQRPYYHPNLMTSTGDGTAIVVWKQDWLDCGEAMQWQDVQMMCDGYRPELDAACDAILSGPIGFELEARRGHAILLRHLPSMRESAQRLSDRMVLELRAGDRGAAWTNLLSLTRLITAWEAEPVEVSQLFRFACLTPIYNATWQALQADWSDEQLLRLQREWEAVDIFKSLPETVAFQRASVVGLCQQYRLEALSFNLTAEEFIKELARSRRGAWSYVSSWWQRLRYRSSGSYEDEKALLLFYRDREIEVRRALQASTWLEMQRLPGVTNAPHFYSKYSSPLQSMMNLREMTLKMQRAGRSSLGGAVETEARRRLLLTVIALERYHLREHSYPKTLASLVPEFLKAPPLDIIDGKPLRYHLTDDGHFVLYSVGLDGVDHDGAMPSRELRDNIEAFTEFGMQSRYQTDLVWPQPAPPAEAKAWHQNQLVARANQAAEIEDRESEARWALMDLRQLEAPRLLAQPPNPCPDPIIKGRRLSDWLRNEAAAGTNKLTLSEMLILKPVLTGAEPETVTFQVPIRYDALTGLGDLNLLVDVANNTGFNLGFIALQTETKAATNGDCLVTWNTLFETPGLHALQLFLTLKVATVTSEFLGPMFPCVVSNVCQFSLGSATFNPEVGAVLHARLPEPNGIYSIELLTTAGEHLKTFAGATSNGVLTVSWDLVDDRGRRLTNEVFNSKVHITLPDSGRSQTLRGP